MKYDEKNALHGSHETYHSDALEGENSCPEKQGKLFPRGELRPGVDAGQILKHIVETNGNTGADQEVGKHGERSEIFEVPDEVDDD